jgi:hypothetical protein
MSDDTLQAVWNFDGAELYAIFEIKKEFMICMLNWDLENAFWKLRILRMELDAKLQRAVDTGIIEKFEKELGRTKKETEKAFVDRRLGEIEQKRDTYNSFNPPTDEQKGEFFRELEKFYMEVCFLMKKHGLYFREGEDNRLAILRR